MFSALPGTFFTTKPSGKLLAYRTAKEYIFVVEVSKVVYFVAAAKTNYSALQTLDGFLSLLSSLSVCVYHLSLPWFLNPIA